MHPCTGCPPLLWAARWRVARPLGPLASEGECKSMSLLWIRISQRSKVLVPRSKVPASSTSRGTRGTHPVHPERWGWMRWVGMVFHGNRLRWSVTELIMITNMLLQWVLILCRSTLGGAFHLRCRCFVTSIRTPPSSSSLQSHQTKPSLLPRPPRLLRTATSEPSNARSSLGDLHGRGTRRSRRGRHMRCECHIPRPSNRLLDTRTPRITSKSLYIYYIYIYIYRDAGRRVLVEEIEKIYRRV